MTEGLNSLEANLKTSIANVQDALGNQKHLKTDLNTINTWSYADTYFVPMRRKRIESLTNEEIDHAKDELSLRQRVMQQVYYAAQLCRENAEKNNRMDMDKRSVFGPQTELFKWKRNVNTEFQSIPPDLAVTINGVIYETRASTPGIGEESFRSDIVDMLSRKSFDTPDGRRKFAALLNKINEAVTARVKKTHTRFKPVLTRNGLLIRGFDVSDPDELEKNFQAVLKRSFTQLTVNDVLDFIRMDIKENNKETLKQWMRTEPQTLLSLAKMQDGVGKIMVENLVNKYWNAIETAKKRARNDKDYATREDDIKKELGKLNWEIAKVFGHWINGEEGLAQGLSAEERIQFINGVTLKNILGAGKLDHLDKGMIVDYMCEQLFEVRKDSVRITEEEIIFALETVRTVFLAKEARLRERKIKNLPISPLDYQKELKKIYDEMMKDPDVQMRTVAQCLADNRLQKAKRMEVVEQDKLKNVNIADKEGRRPAYKASAEKSTSPEGRLHVTAQKPPTFIETFIEALKEPAPEAAWVNGQTVENTEKIKGAPEKFFGQVSMVIKAVLGPVFSAAKRTVVNIFRRLRTVFTVKKTGGLEVVKKARNVEGGVQRPVVEGRGFRAAGAETPTEMIVESQDRVVPVFTDGVSVRTADGKYVTISGPEQIALEESINELKAERRAQLDNGAAKQVDKLIQSKQEAPALYMSQNGRAIRVVVMSAEEIKAGGPEQAVQTMAAAGIAGTLSPDGEIIAVFTGLTGDSALDENRKQFLDKLAAY
ncbi:MAG: hypothetical protein HQL28_07250, partial [Candidatus Omnitrophica bacterium]|nr:hypothetical protein [Candidatus Omnitrophota bacterium]